MKTKNHILPTTIIIFSLWTLVNALFHPSDIYSFMSVFTGLFGVIMYYRDNKNYDKIFYLWVFMQLPNITYSDVNIISAFPLSFGFGLGLGLKNNNNLDLYFNALPIALYFMVKYFNVDKPLKKTLTIKRLRKGTFPQIQFPISGIIDRISGRNKMTAVYLIILDNEITVKEKPYNYILLEPKDNTLIDTNNKWQVCGLRVCENPDQTFNDKQNQFVDWVTVQTK